jgi:hypothetical protein
VTDDFFCPAREREPEHALTLQQESGEVPRSERPAKPSGSLYNFIKSVAKLEDSEQARVKLAALAVKAAHDLDQKNAKGSSALHACGYLKRWDLAQILLDAGANPSLRNAAGHSFFLTAVREPEAPWRRLFAGHPELIEKHERFLAKNGVKLETGDPSRAAKDPKPSNFSLDATSAQKALAAYVDQADWSAPAPSLRAQDVAAKLLDASRQSKLAREMPLAMAFDLLEQGVKLGHEALAAMAERCFQAQDWDGAHRWGALTSQATPQTQERLMDSLLRDGRDEALIELARSGWPLDDDFIERCEEFERYDLADALIDLRASRRMEKAAPSAPKKAAGKVGPAKGRKPSALKKSKPQSSRKTGVRKPAMIANLDAPLREASDYSYQERKPLAKAPVIIVKKARSILGPAEGHGDA